MERQSELVRTVVFGNEKICYCLERKTVKNLNLRVHKDGSVFVSANQQVPVSRIDSFVVSKGNYICSAQKKFAKMAQYTPQPKQYVSGGNLLPARPGTAVEVGEECYLFIRTTNRLYIKARKGVK